MHDITIHPRAALPGDPDDTASISGDTVTHNGVAFDLSAVPEGGDAAPEGEAHPFIGRITRNNGVLIYGLRMEYDTATAEPDQPTAPAHWRVPINSGAVPDRVSRKPVKEPQE